MSYLKLVSITKSYDNNTIAVSNISFDINEGELLVLVGPSGCGKSTLLRMIAGLESITAGDLFLEGKRINDISPANRDVGMVFQNYALYPHLTVEENIGFPLSIRHESKLDIKRKVRETAEMIGLSNLLSRKPKELSGGQRQRVALGRAIIRNPRLFLFDEPLSNLDAQLRVQMRTEIISLQRKLGVTSVYVTHDQTEAMTMGDKIAVLNDGIIQQIATPTEIYHSPHNEFVASFIGSPQINLFKGKFDNSLNYQFIENNNGCSLSLVADLPEKILSLMGAKCTLGIRPEQFVLAESEPKYNEQLPISYCSVVVTSVEFIGHETLIFFQTAGELKCCRTKSSLNVQVGQLVCFSFDVRDILIFDGNGIRL